MCASDEKSKTKVWQLSRVVKMQNVTFEVEMLPVRNIQKGSEEIKV